MHSETLLATFKISTYVWTNVPSASLHSSAMTQPIHRSYMHTEPLISTALQCNNKDKKKTHCVDLMEKYIYLNLFIDFFFQKKTTALWWRKLNDTANASDGIKTLMRPWLYMQHNSNTERVRCLHKAKITCSPWLFIKPMQSVLKRLKAEVIPFISSLLVAAKVCWYKLDTKAQIYIFCIIHQNPSNQRHTWESIIDLNPLIIKSHIRECLILFMPHISNISKFNGIFSKNKRYLIIFNV